MSEDMLQFGTKAEHEAYGKGGQSLKIAFWDFCVTSTSTHKRIQSVHQSSEVGGQFCSETVMLQLE